ncbi:hypothetical protein [Massilia aquatica]|uniref:hypothetical protein n=1 Tax=Massilia aquatica TaxID=2609000 RepID=UPI0014245337
MISAISLGPDKFTIDDFAKYFPDSPWLKKQLAPAGSTFREIAATWLLLAGQELAETSVKEYRNTLNRYFLPVFGEKQIATITYEDLSLHMAAADIASLRTVNNVMIPLRCPTGRGCCK